MEHCRFLEDGDFTDWYKDHCPQNDRRKILDPFEVPGFLSNETSTALNGYFGCKTSLKSPPSPSSPSNSGNKLDTPSPSNSGDKLDTPSPSSPGDELKTLSTSSNSATS